MTTQIRYIVFTDLDGTLLNADTYGFEAARPALELLSARSVPVVLCSSKTAPEMVRLSKALGTRAPLVVENGGALLVGGEPGLPPGWGEPRQEGWRQMVLGRRYEDLAAALARLRQELNLSLRGFAEMDAAEVAQLTGLPAEEAELARAREFSEPFTLEGGEEGLRALSARAAALGLRVVRGLRFHHLMGATDKARALRLARDLYAASWGGGPIASIGLGDSPNDLLMLLNVDLPVLVRAKTGRGWEPGCDIPGLYRTALPGPAGWNEAIHHILNERRRP